jgi:hypothetical protein
VGSATAVRSATAVAAAVTAALGLASLARGLDEGCCQRRCSSGVNSQQHNLADQQSAVASCRVCSLVPQQVHPGALALMAPVESCTKAQRLRCCTTNPPVALLLPSLSCCLCHCPRSAVLSTISSHPSSADFPFGSVVEFAVDDAGQPLLATSTLSPHTADLQADGRCSVTVMAPGFSVRHE